MTEGMLKRYLKSAIAEYLRDGLERGTSALELLDELEFGLGSVASEAAQEALGRSREEVVREYYGESA